MIIAWYICVSEYQEYILDLGPVHIERLRRHR